MQQLDPSVKTVWVLPRLIFTIGASLVVLVYEIIKRGEIHFVIDLPFGFLSGMVIILGLFYSIIMPILKYRYWKFEVRDEELYVERGVFNRVHTIAPISRIQHLDVSHNVFENMLGIGKLVIYTAGTRGADIVIPGLPIEYAENLRDHLKNYSPEDAV